MTDVLLNTVGEMKICGIEPDMLTKTAEAVAEDSLSRKLKEIALIYGTYEALVAQTYLDPLDDLTRLDDLLADHPDFSEILMSPSMRLTASPCRSTAFCATHCAMRKSQCFAVLRRSRHEPQRPVFYRAPHRFAPDAPCKGERYGRAFACVL